MSTAPLNILLVGLGSIGSVYAYMLEKVSFAGIPLHSADHVVGSSESYCCGSLQLRLVHKTWRYLEDGQIRGDRRLEAFQR
jgi:hypothetical protein